MGSSCSSDQPTENDQRSPAPPIYYRYESLPHNTLQRSKKRSKKSEKKQPNEAKNAMRSSVAYPEQLPDLTPDGISIDNNGVADEAFNQPPESFDDRDEADAVENPLEVCCEKGSASASDSGTPIPPSPKEPSGAASEHNNPAASVCVLIVRPPPLLQPIMQDDEDVLREKA